MFIILLSLISCKRTQRSVVLGDLTAVGSITSDTVYDGLIKFFDTKSNRLVSAINYKKGIMEGVRIDYNNNGTIRSTLIYRNGETDGEAVFYDSTGQIVIKRFYSKGIRIGNEVKFRNKIEKYYSFFNLEGKKIFEIDYDSLVKKPIDQLQEGFFYYSTYSYPDTSIFNHEPNAQILLYIMSPPRLKFEYSIVRTSDYKNNIFINEIKNTKPYQIISIPMREVIFQPENLRLMLTIFDSTRNDKIIAYKKIDFGYE